jgi:hypothetical protein
VIATVREWARVPDDKGISRADVLADLWVRHGQGGLAYCTDAANDLLDRLIREFRKPPAAKLKFQTADFCPQESAPLKTIADVCTAVDQSE